MIREDIPKLSSENKRRIRRVIQRKLCTFPELYGKSLKKALQGARVVRVGGYRIVYRIRGHNVEIAASVHRSSDYRDVKRRLSP